jgi:hypothetical protein
MVGQRGLRLLRLCFLGVLAAGCCPPAAMRVETTIHSDGSCDRMIWQPKDKFLPEGALEPEWNARWKTVSDGIGRPGGSDSKALKDDCKYFIARGSFNSPREIPPHYHFAVDLVPDAGASELERTYERIDYGFCVEHRWQEKITNIVTLPGFLKARDELLDLLLPAYIEAIERIFGNDYDVSRLANHLRVNGRRFLENVCLILYDALARGRVLGEDGTPDVALTKHLFDEAEHFGLDSKLFVGMMDPKESDRMAGMFFGQLIVQYFRRHDGTAVTATEADALIQAIQRGHRYEKEIQEQSKRIGDRLKGDKKLEMRVNRAVLQMAGLYVPLQFMFAGGPPEYEFSIFLPGELMETNGTRLKAGRTRWKFTGSQMFPDGYEMKARSIQIDRDGQKKTLGHVVIDDETKAIDFMEAVGRNGPLLEAVRNLRQTADRNALSQVKTRTIEESMRASKLWKMLFNE